MTPDREPDRTARRPAARVVLATQLLATAGWIAFALPFGSQALGSFVTFTSHSEPDPMARMATAIEIVLSPAPLAWATALLGAAVALYQAWPFGRLVAGAAAWGPLGYV